MTVGRRAFWKTLKALLAVFAVAATSTESSAAENLYFDAEALHASAGAFNSSAVPASVTDYTPLQWRSFDPAKPLDFTVSAPQRGIFSWSKEESGDSFGRVPFNGGSFGIETERKFNSNKIIPSSQYFESMTDKNSKKPFVGLSIDVPYDSLDQKSPGTN